MVTGELDEVLDELNLGTLQYCEIFKEVAGGSIRNVERGGEFTT